MPGVHTSRGYAPHASDEPLMADTWPCIVQTLSLPCGVSLGGQEKALLRLPVPQLHPQLRCHLPCAAFSAAAPLVDAVFAVVVSVSLVAYGALDQLDDHDHGLLAQQWRARHLELSLMLLLLVVEEVVVVEQLLCELLLHQGLHSLLREY